MTELGQKVVGWVVVGVAVETAGTSMIGGSQGGDGGSPSPWRRGEEGESRGGGRAMAKPCGQPGLAACGSKPRLDQTSICRTGRMPARKIELRVTRQPGNRQKARTSSRGWCRQSLTGQDWRAVRPAWSAIQIEIEWVRASARTPSCFPAGAAHRSLSIGTAARSCPGRGRFCRGGADPGRRGRPCQFGVADGRRRRENTLSRW